MLWCLKWQILVRNNGILHGDFPDLLDYLRTDFSYVELPLRFPRKVPNEIIFYFHSKSWFQFSSVAQSCLSLWDPMDGRPPGSSAPVISQARVLEQAVMPSSKGSYHPGMEPVYLTSPALASVLSTTSASWEAPVKSYFGHWLQLLQLKASRCPILPSSMTLSMHNP